MRAFPRGTPAKKETSVTMIKMFVRVHPVPIPMEFVKKVRTVVPVLQIVSAVPAVDPVMPASKTSATASVIQKKKPLIVRTACQATAVVTACVKELKTVTIAQ
jgi:hypothetical protein